MKTALKSTILYSSSAPGGNMKFRVLFAFSLISLCLCAPKPYVKGEGDPCKSIEVTEDAFGKVTRSKAIFQGMGYYGVSLYETESKCYMQMLFSVPGLTSTVCPTGTPGKVGLVDGTIIDLKTYKDTEPTRRGNSQTVYTIYLMEYELDAATLEKLSNSPIKAVQATINNQDLQLELEPGEGYELQEAADCLYQSAK